MAGYSTAFPLVFLFLCAFFVTNLCPARARVSRTRCHRTCGGEETPYPFGFSAGCPILLNCSNNSPFVEGFEFQSGSISKAGKFKIRMPRDCNRSVSELRRLYGHNFAPTRQNAVLLDDCTSGHPCNLPSINAETRFDSVSCNRKSNVSCFNNESINGFFDYKKVMNTTNCKYLLSSISLKESDSATLLDIEVLELEWWIPGNKCSCSENANCSKVNTPEEEGFRCLCKDGMIGDGYRDGEGCREECNFGNWVAGSCGGAGRIGMFVGGGAFVAGIILLILLCTWWRRSNSKTWGYAKKTEASEFTIPVYSFKVIARATDGFSDKQKLGNGAYGTVYAGKLSNESWVAIKRSKDSDSASVEQFMNEIELVSLVDHPNLVKLLGCCIENGEQILVYEFMPNGTLYQHLQRDRGSGLSWVCRLAIAAETAQAVAHIHSAIDPPIYHRDIKSSNILLDCNFRPKLADFGLSRLGKTEKSHISTAPLGTLGYLDPQYHQNFHLSDKSDVYSFGVVLVEIITAMKVVDFTRPTNEVSLAALAADKIAKGRLSEIVDITIDLRSDGWTLFSISKVAELAFRCLAYDRDSRPSMMEVAEELEQIRLSKGESSTEIDWSTSSLEKSFCSSSSNANDEPPFSEARLSPLENRSSRSFYSCSALDQ